MREHPIVVELRSRRFWSQRDTDIPATRRISDSAMDAGSASDSDIEADVRNREFSVVSTDRIPGALDPTREIATTGSARLAEELNIDGCPANLHARGRTGCLPAGGYKPCDCHDGTNGRDDNQEYAVTGTCGPGLTQLHVPQILTHDETKVATQPAHAERCNQ